jgi:putative DNA primase/helicase
MKAEVPQLIREALSFVPPRDRETWLRMGMAVKSELGDAGYPLWDEWSQQDESYNTKDAKSVWRSIQVHGKVGIGTLFHEAKRRGFKVNGEASRVNPAEIERLERERAEEVAREQLELEKGHVQAARWAAAIWKAATPVTQGHPYLARKRVAPVSTMREIAQLRAQAILGYMPKRGEQPLAGRLLVVPVKLADQLTSLELIDEQGLKTGLYRGTRAGGYWAAHSLPDGNGEGLTLAIGEGVATVLSAKEASGVAVVAALSAGNLMKVATAMRARYPVAQLIVLADLGNGEDKARNAAAEVGALLALPDFRADRPHGAKDFNDLALHRGLDAVRHCLAKAAAPGRADAGMAARSGPEWPEPQALPDGLPAVAAFDFALLPKTLRSWAEDICDRVQCAPDYVAVTIIVAAGSLIGRKVGIRPQERTDWTEFANLWALAVGRPGVLKSPAMEAALSPLKKLAALAAESHTEAMVEYEDTAKLAKLRAAASEKAATKALARNPRAAIELVGDEPEVPTLRRYIATDTTPAALGELLRQNANGLLVFRDELVSLLKGLDREEYAEARGFYLTGWAGNSAYTIDRIGRGMNLHIPAVCISMLGSTQPGRISEYLRAAVKGGAGDDGLIQRFSLLVWPDIGGSWRDVDRWPDSEARRKANAVFEALDRLLPEAIGAQKDEFDAVPYVRFDGEGLALFREWREGWEAKLRAGDLHPALESHLAKYRKLVPGLALTLHLAGGSVGPVNGRATLQALAWAEYLETHARRAYASVTCGEVTAAKAILEKLRRGELPRAFAARDIYRKGWAHLSDRETVNDALQLLMDLDWVTVTVVPTQGRSAAIYEANPRGLP